MKIKLALFDIDGTLIYHVKSHRFEDQYEYAIKKVFGVDAPFDLARFNGTLDRQNSWTVVREHGISREIFEKKFPVYIDTMHQLLAKRGENLSLYRPIPEALTLIQRLFKDQTISLGVITGNAKRIADWKLEHTNLAQYFRFGLYGDEADDRSELAGKVFEKSRKTIGLSLHPKDVVVVGDTVFDIRCGQAIGAFTIGVTTGMHGPKDTLTLEKPTLVVESLLDPQVLTLFSLQ